MDTIYLHIEYLLRTHDCVIVPGIGAFIVSRRPAYFDREAGVILPPSQEISFNASIQHNDGLIANSIARRAMIDYQSALEITLDQVAEMRSRLDSRRRLDIGSIGTLTLGPEDNIIFTPDSRLIGMSATLGLHQIILPRPAEETPEETTAPAEVAAETPAPQPEGRRFRTDKYYYIPVHKVFVKVAAMIAVVAAVAISVILHTPADNGGPHRDVASVIPVAIESVKPAPAPKADIAIADTAKAKYHVVVGTFTTDDEVERFMRRHSDDGYDLRVIKGKKYTRVTADRGADRQQMVSTLRSERLDSCFSNAWIWEN